MRRRGIFIIMALMFVGCAARRAVPPVYKLNVELIAESIKKIEVPKYVVRKGERVAVISLETVEAANVPVNYLIEDQLIQKIAKLEAIPVERNPLLVRNLISESEDRFTYFWRDTLSRSTNLSAADKILAYRVLECGLRYEEEAEKPKGACCIAPLPGTAKGGMIKRVAYTSLHLRIEDTKTSIVRWAGELEGRVTDRIPQDMVEPLKERELIFYKHGLPNK